MPNLLYTLGQSTMNRSESKEQDVVTKTFWFPLYRVLYIFSDYTLSPKKLSVNNISPISSSSPVNQDLTVNPYIVYFSVTIRII